MNNININKIVIFSKVPFGKKILNIFLITKLLEKFDLYVYFFQRRLS